MIINFLKILIEIYFIYYLFEKKKIFFLQKIIYFYLFINKKETNK
jgi:hypothetical protein